MVSRRRRKSESGQATTEYIILVAIIALAVISVKQALYRANVADRMMGNRSAVTQYQAAYKYGHPKAKGFDEGAPEHHPRFDTGGTNFRIFIRQAGP